MKLTDIIELAKRGYKPNDIKELISLSEDKGEDNPPAAGAPEGLPEDSSEKPEGTEEEKDTSSAGSNDDSIDYKKLYEESQAALAKAQQDNINKDINPTNNDEAQKHLADSIRGFM